MFLIGGALSVGLAVGANSATFSLASAIWHRPDGAAQEGLLIPYRPVAVSADGALLDMFPARLQEQFEAAEAFDAVTFELNTASRMGDWQPIVRLAADQPPLSVAVVAHDYFRVLGVHVRGPGFGPADEQLGAAPRVIVSRNFWKTKLGGDPAVIGQHIQTTREPLMVVGVVDSDFTGLRFGDRAELWLPLGSFGAYADIARSAAVRPLMPLTVVARLAPTWTMAAAEAQVRAIADRRAILVPLADAGFRIRSEGDLLRQHAFFQLLWLTAATVLVLGAANLASLILARVERRRGEFAIRQALGASAASRQALMFWDVGVVAILGVAVGLGLRSGLLASIGGLQLPSGITVSSLPATLDIRTFLVALAATLLIVAMACAGPMRRAGRIATAELLAASSRTTSGRFASTRRALLTVHIALSMMLLSTAIGLVLTLSSALAGGFRFDQDGTIFVTVRPRAAQYMRGSDDGAAERAAAYGAFVQDLEALPGVARATFGPPIANATNEEFADALVSSEGHTAKLPVLVRRAGPGYLDALGTPLLAGRDLAPPDVLRAVDPGAVLLQRFEPPSGQKPATDTPGIAIIDLTLARSLWSNANPIGRTFEHGALKIRYEVIGLIDTVHHGGLLNEGVATLITVRALSQDNGTNPLNAVVRTDSPAGDQAIDAIRTLALRSFPDPALLELSTGREILQRKTGRERMTVTLVGGYAVLSVGLAIIGIVGLVSYAIARSRRELAIRSALGGTRAALHYAALASPARAVILGLFLGVAGAGAADRLLRASLFGFGADGWLHYAVAAIALALAASAAMFASTRELRRIDASFVLHAP